MRKTFCKKFTKMKKEQNRKTENKNKGRRNGRI